MKRIALIAAAVVLTACGGAAEEAATPAVEEQPAAMDMAPAMDDSMQPDTAETDSAEEAPAVDSASM
jgi:hypothetical protein